MNSRHIQFDEKKLRRLIHNFDKDNDFSIDYSEFINMIHPKSSSVPNAQLELKDPTEDIRIPSDSESSFIRLLTMELGMVQTLADIAEKFKVAKEFTTYEAFTSIVGDDLYITVGNLCNFLKKKGIIVNSDDAGKVMSRIDADADGKISYEEFVDIFFPFAIYQPVDRIPMCLNTISFNRTKLTQTIINPSCQEDYFNSTPQVNRCGNQLSMRTSEIMERSCSPGAGYMFGGNKGNVGESPKVFSYKSSTMRESSTVNPEKIYGSGLNFRTVKTKSMSPDKTIKENVYMTPNKVSNVDNPDLIKSAPVNCPCGCGCHCHFTVHCCCCH